MPEQASAACDTLWEKAGEPKGLASSVECVESLWDFVLQPPREAQVVAE